MEHTQEKWRIADDDKRFVFATDKNGYNAFTCLVQAGSAFLGELEANAQLIVAAPETKQQRDNLLAACKKLYQAMIDYEIDVNDIDTNPPYEHRAMMEEAKQAIAEAENK